MPIEVELPDGRVAEFPDGTSEEKILQSVIGYSKDVAGIAPDVPELPPQGGQFQQTAPMGFWEEFKRDIPALAGSIAGPLVAQRLGPIQAAGPAVQRGAQMIGSGIGAAVGEAVQAGKEMLGEEKEAPKTAGEFATRVGKTGAEYAAFEGIGQLALKTASVVRQRLTPTMDDLSKALTTKFREYGGELTAPQASDSWVLQQLDGLSRGSLTGSGVFKMRDASNEAAFKVMEDDLIRNISRKATTDLSDEQLGNLFLNTVKGGRAAHANAAGIMYSEVDDLVGAAGVPTNAIKTKAADYLNQYQKIANIGGGEVNMELLKNTMKLPENISFHDAHFLRSSLLSMSRDLEGVVGAGRAKKIIGELVGEIDNTMMKSAEATSPAAADAYKAASKFYAHGKEIFDNKFIAGLILQNKKNPEKIGETIFRTGNVTEITQAKKALKAASKLDPSLDSEMVWGSMQAGYLNSLLKGMSDAEGNVSARRLAKAFVDPKTKRSLQAAFTKEQRDKIIEFALVGEKIQKSSEGGLGMVMQLSQAGTIMKLAEGGALALGASGTISPGEMMGVMIAPRVIAKALTNPKTVDLMMKSMTTRADTTLGKQLSTKLAAELGKIKADFGDSEEESLPQMGVSQ